MKIRIKSFLLTIVILTRFSVNAQNCDCTIYPVKSGCEKECGLFYVLNGTKEQLEKNLKIDKSTATKIIKISNREKFKTIQDFKPKLPKVNYEELELKYNNFITSVTIQNNQNGNNFNGGQTVQTQINGNPFVYIINNDNAKVGSIKFEIAQKNRERRTNISQLYREGDNILILLSTDTLNVELNNKIDNWYNKTRFYLDTIEPSFLIRFEKPYNDIDSSLSFGLKRPENENMYKFIRTKIRVLYNLINELKSDFYN